MPKLIGRFMAPLAMTTTLACMAIAGCGRDDHAQPGPATSPGAAATSSVILADVAAPPAPAAPPATAPVALPPMIPWADKKDGVSLAYPGDWTSKEDKDYVLRLVATGSDRTITFDVPDLPFHIPGMIPLGMVASGYTDDLKEKHADRQIDSQADHPIAGAPKAKLVQTSWKQNGTKYNNIALLIVHGDHVYILAAEASDADWPASKAAFDKIAGAIQWVK